MDKDAVRDYELDIIIKAWKDESFRQKLIKNPKSAIEKEFDITIPKDTEIFVHEESDRSIHLIVPSIPANFSADELSDDELKDVIGGVISTGHMLSFPSTKDRVRLRQYQREVEQLKEENEKLKADVAKHRK